MLKRVVGSLIFFRIWRIKNIIDLKWKSFVTLYINVFTVTFDQCNASLLINLFQHQINLTDPKRLHGSVLTVEVTCTIWIVTCSIIITYLSGSQQCESLSVDSERMTETSHTLQHLLMSSAHLIKPKRAVHTRICMCACEADWHESGPDEPLGKSCSGKYPSQSLCAAVSEWTHGDGHVGLSRALLPRHKQILNLHLSLQLCNTRRISE